MDSSAEAEALKGLIKTEKRRKTLKDVARDLDRRERNLSEKRRNIAMKAARLLRAGLVAATIGIILFSSNDRTLVSAVDISQQPDRVVTSVETFHESHDKENVTQAQENIEELIIGDFVGPVRLRDFYGPPTYTMCRIEEDFYDVETEVKALPVEQISGEEGVVDPVEIEVSTDDIDGEYGEPEFNDKGDLKKGVSNVLMIPAGYDNPTELKERMEELRGVLERSYQRLPIYFSYLNKPANLNVTKQGHRAIIDEEQVMAFRALVDEQTGRHYDRAIIILNTDKYMGRSYQAAAIAAGNSTSSYYLAVHELGHRYGLDDRYLHNLTPGGLQYSTEFTVDPALTKDFMLRYAYVVGFELGTTGITCGGKQVYSYFPYDEANVMASANQNPRFFDDEDEFFPFNRLQVQYMWGRIFDDTRSRLETDS